MSEVEDSAECPNCGEHVAPEQDVDLIFYPCGCGYEFGYRRIPQAEGTCAAGISLGHLTTDPVFQSKLSSLTSEETDRLLWGSSKPEAESVVFLGGLIPMRSEDN